MIYFYSYGRPFYPKHLIRETEKYMWGGVSSPSDQQTRALCFWVTTDANFFWVGRFGAHTSGATTNLCTHPYLSVLPAHILLPDGLSSLASVSEIYPALLKVLPHLLFDLVCSLFWISACYVLLSSSVLEYWTVLLTWIIAYPTVHCCFSLSVLKQWTVFD